MQLLLPPRNSKGNTSLGEYLDALEERTGKRDPRLDAAGVPDAGEGVWSIFWKMYSGKPIPFSELRAWAELTGEDLGPWESETIRQMSLVAVKEANSG